MTELQNYKYKKPAYCSSPSSASAMLCLSWLALSTQPILLGQIHKSKNTYTYIGLNI